MADYGRHGVREPEAGYWWVERSDKRLYIVRVEDNQGRKSVLMMGNRGFTGLNIFRQDFRFLHPVPLPVVKPVPDEASAPTKS